MLRFVVFLKGFLSQKPSGYVIFFGAEEDLENFPTWAAL